MEIVFQAVEDIKKGSFVKLDFATGELSTATEKEMELQKKEEANIIENEHELDGLLI